MKVWKQETMMQQFAKMLPEQKYALATPIFWWFASVFDTNLFGVVFDSMQ